MMFASRERRIEHTIAAVGLLQAVRDLEHAALALHFLELLFVRRVRHVLAEHDDARLRRHLVLHRAIDRGDHRVRLAFRTQRRVERRRRRIDVWRIHPEPRAVLRRLLRLDRGVGSLVDLAIDVLRHRVEVVVCRQPFRDEVTRQLRDGIARRFFRALGRRLVQPLVVRQRMRVGTDAVGVNERRSAPLAAPRHGFAHRSQAVEDVRAVAPQDLQPGPLLDELGQAAAGRLHFHRHRDRVAVVFDHEHHRRLPDAGGAQRLPEFPFGRRPVADGDVGDFVGAAALFAIGQVGKPLIEHAGFGAADGVKALRAGRARLRDDVQRLVPPMRRHLAAAAVRVVLRADGAQEHLEGVMPSVRHSARSRYTGRTSRRPA